MSHHPDQDGLLPRRRQAAPAHPPRRATVVDGPQYRTIICVDTTGEQIDVTSRFQMHFPVGTRGWVQYQRFGAGALYVFWPLASGGPREVRQAPVRAEVRKKSHSHGEGGSQ